MRRLCLTLMFAAAMVAGEAILSAQQEGDERDEPSGATITEQTKSYVVESIGVIALFGAALFGVCRSSRRGT